ncbi:S-adenosyl-L-methionine-dependent methyltransferase [Geopyxis carbonaria]|nr:S-adenosyl-L-methionine-dependent methyltransferase [Geopyxis carbonaria]
MCHDGPSNAVGEDSDNSQIAVDTSLSTDSDYGTSLNSTALSQSITSTIFDYVYENGRRYHRYAEGRYAMPNDETEQDRLDLQHHLHMLMLKGALYSAPIKPENLHKVLDIGTGTGIWALDMAETHPQAEVIGTDLSPIQPAWVFPNCKFEVDDMEMVWTYPEASFDFVHARDMAQSIKDWPKLVSEAFHALRPGGWIELAENQSDIQADDKSVTPTSGIRVFMDRFHDAMDILKMTLVEGRHLEQYLKEAGFVDVKVHTIKRPWGIWPKEKSMKQIGQITALLGETGFEAYGLGLFTRVLKLPLEQAKDLCKAASDDLKNRHVHPYNYVWHVVGRKPEEGEL